MVVVEYPGEDIPKQTCRCRHCGAGLSYVPSDVRIIPMVDNVIDCPACGRTTSIFSKMTGREIAALIFACLSLALFLAVAIFWSGIAF